MSQTRPVLLATFPGMTPHQVELLVGFVASMQAWGASAATIKARRVVVVALLQRWPDLTVVTDHEVRTWLATPSWSAKTRSAYCSHARSFFSWLVEADYLTVDPMAKVRSPRYPKGKPRPLSIVEQRLVLGSATGDLWTWLQLGMLAGLRAHEVAKISGEDVTEEAVYVVGKGGKAAMIPTHPAMWQIAQGYPRVGHWFPSAKAACGHVTAGTVTNRTTRLFRSLGIPGSHHRARHTFGTNLLRGGSNLRVVQDLMRHESLATTEVYTLVDSDERRSAVHALNA